MPATRTLPLFPDAQTPASPGTLEGNFLDQTARDYIAKFDSKLKGHCVILPSRRAVFFFKQALFLASGKALELPAVYAIDDFISHLSQTSIVDPVFLQLELYDLLKPMEEDLDFDQFLTWSGILLEDFSRIDQYMADARQVFEFMTEVKALERWEPETATNSPALLRHFRLWENLHKVYNQLRENLLLRNQAYAGLAYRKVAENIHKIVEAGEFERYIFVGLNGLSTSEETIVKYLLKMKMVDMYWDTDSFYMKPDPNMKAGNYLRQYKANLGLTEWNWEGDDLLTSEKFIKVIGVSNATLQGKVTGQIVGDLCRQNAQCATAIILPDENLLLPVLHSLHENLNDLNITMGLGLPGTSLFNFVELLFELHGTAISTPEEKQALYNHKTVSKLLSHPYILRYENHVLQHTVSGHQVQFSARQLIQHLVKNNIVLISQNEIAKAAPNHPLLTQLFAPWKNHHDALAGLYHFVELFREVYKAEPNAIELEYFYLFYTILRKIDTTFDNSGRVFSVRSFKKFLYERIKQTTLPFNGEPISPLQIMGMLETRAVDFERVIILSANEDVLPQGRRQSSLLPFDALQTFGLPTQNEQEGLTAYYFYRLLQRAKEVFLVHVLPSDTYGANEKSRFILQLQHDLARQNPRIHIEELTASLRTETKKRDDQAINIAKDRVTLAKVFQYLETGISPSAINSYITCTLQFYFSRIAKLREADSVDEALGADQFGTIVHEVLEKLYEPFTGPGRRVEKEDIEAMKFLVPDLTRKAFERLVKSKYSETGMNHLLKKVAEKVIHNFLQKQIETEQFPFRVLALESELAANLDVNIAEANFRAVIKGFADRIDLHDSHVRVIDYKTGKVEAADLKKQAANLAESLLHNDEGSKIRQLWLYKYLLAKMLKETDAEKKFAPTIPIPTELLSIDPGIYSLRNIPAGFLRADISFSEAETMEEFILGSERILQKIIADIVDPAYPFQKTSNLEACFYCPYTTICSRAEK